MTEVALQTVNLVRRVQGVITHTLVNGIDLSVAKGEFLAITGPSGSGKSSLLYLLGLLDAPTEGEVIICGQATSKLSETERADVRLTKCGFVFQFHFLLPEFTALDNVLLPMRAHGKLSAKDMNDRAMSLLTSLGLGEQTGKRPNQLSGGQRQRVALARALANRPEIIVADEPTGNLDTASTQQVFGILRDIADNGQTVVVVTHGGVVSGFFRHTLAIPLDAPRRFEFVNAGLNVFAHDEGIWLLLTWGDVSHLAPGAASEGDDP
jgi:lipoprotein-releasing system ATP-binding protein